MMTLPVVRGDYLEKNDKLYEKIKRQPKQRSYKELTTLLESYGFIISEAGKGSHATVRHGQYSDLRWTLSRKKPMAIYHSRKVLSLVEEVMECEKDCEDT